MPPLQPPSRTCCWLPMPSVSAQNGKPGEWARDPNVKEFLGFEPDQHIAGFVYIGYPEFQEQFPPRPSFEDRTVWME